jgi:uncharacterized protein (TIGR00369 family)
VSRASGPQASDADLLARFRAAKNQPSGSRTLGFEIVDIDQAAMRVEVLFNASDAFLNPMGQIQGGFLCAMLDECMSVAGVVASGVTHVMPTLEMKTSFLRPALPGPPLRGVGRVVKWGKTIAFTEGELYDSENRLLAKATATAMPTPLAKFKKPPGEGGGGGK